MKTCKTCKAEFVQFNTIQTLCTACLIIKGRKIAVKNAKVTVLTKKRELIKDKERIKTRSQWMKEAQAAFNSWVRFRDKKIGYGCISCGTRNGKENCGHYRSVGSSPELRFNELNCHLQCEKCNTYLHGNLINYRLSLIDRIGLEKVDWLESKHEAKHYSIDDLKEIKKTYKVKINIQGSKE